MYDQTRSELAYAERGMPKLRYELASDQLIIRQKALTTMSDLMHNNEKVHEAVRVGCLDQIIYLLLDTDETVRYKAVAVLQNIVQHTVGREAFIALSGLKNLILLFKDPSVKIQLKAFQAVEEVSTVQLYASLINKTGLAKVLVTDHLCNIKAALSGEELQVVLTALAILQKLLFVQEEFIIPLKNEDGELLSAEARSEASKKVVENETCQITTLTAIIRLAKHSQAEIRSSACVALHDLCCNSAVAKMAASKDQDLLPELVKLISDPNKDVRIASCQAVMTICITTAGKLSAFEHGVCEKLLVLIDECLECSQEIGDCVNAQNDSLRLNCIRAVQVMSEVPSARMLFNKKGNVGKIMDLESNKKLSSDVRRAAKETIGVIQWMP